MLPSRKKLDKPVKTKKRPDKKTRRCNYCRQEHVVNPKEHNKKFFYCDDDCRFAAIHVNTEDTDV